MDGLLQPKIPSSNRIRLPFVLLESSEETSVAYDLESPIRHAELSESRSLIGPKGRSSANKGSE